MPQPLIGPNVDAIETILDAHSITSTFEDRHSNRSGNVCRCGTKHPLYDNGRFPTHTRHLAEQIANLLVEQ